MTANNLIMRKLRVMNFKKMNELAEKIAKINNKSKTYVKFDMFRNFLKYGIGYTDYLKSDYINLTKEEKKTFVSTKSYFNLLAYLNNRKYRIVMQDKFLFNKFFNKYVKREFIDLRYSNAEDLKKFIQGKETIFCKSVDDFGGHNMSKVVIADVKDVDELYKNLCSKKQFLIEETIIQCKELQRLNPYAVNSFRIVTFLNGKDVYILGNALRINVDKEVSIGCSDAYVRLNEDGTNATPFVDDLANIYEKHPLTGEDLTKIKIPYIKEAFDMVKKAALEMPEIRYIGWDVTITENGPIIVEGNEYPSYGLVQYYLLSENPKKGQLGYIADIIGDEIKNIKKLKY